MHIKKLVVPRTLLVLVGAACALAGGCKQQQIDVVKQQKDSTGDYGRLALRAAVDKFRATPKSPVAFRALALEVDRLRPSFNQDVKDEAERHLVFLALAPMAAELDKPFEEQMSVLALTVWPTVFNVQPLAGETPQQFLERACRDPLAAECKHVVPESWPLVLTARVWRRMKSRARDAYGKCRQCTQEPTYAALLEQYDQHESRMTRVANEEEDRSERSAWPEAGDNGSDWSGAPVLDLVRDPPTINGDRVEGAWRDRLRVARPRGQTVLGLHLRPGTEVRHLRAVLAAAAAAGYQSVALQARRRDYPYALVEYRLAAGRGGGRPVDVRDIDTIQYLVRTLDNGGGTAARPVRLSVR